MIAFEKKGWYRLRVPDGWEVDGAAEPVEIHHPDGAGALQVTAQAPRPLKPGERIDVFLLLRGYLRGIGIAVEEIQARRWSERGLDWAACEYDADSAGEGLLHWRMWLATNHDAVVFITYACREEDKDRERAVVDRIAGSLELL